ncbi:MULTISPECIES: YfbM family protein [Fusobacterium]|uniref:YfbM family protein n=1 Tax=Fusobacterium TaxID=848 RepID=UPI000C6FD776|nr:MULTISPECIES: YfbM family protein [Fusobacterium]
MGVIANYQLLGDRELGQLLEISNRENYLKFVEELQERDDFILLDIGKMWDALHFIFCGIGAGTPIEGYPLSEAVVGQYVICEDYFVSYTDRERVRKIVRALENVDYKKIICNIDVDSCKERGVYPNIWNKSKEEIITDLMEVFENMKKFYREAYENRKNILISIY